MLPAISNDSDYSAVIGNDAVWLPAVTTVCRRHDVPTTGLEREPPGTHVVYRSGPYVIKLFCPLWRDQAVAEVACLKGVQGLEIPKLVATGSLEGWEYIVMSVIEGVPAIRVWDSISHEDRLEVVGQLGEWIRSLHGSRALPELKVDWDAFLVARRSGCERHHRMTGKWNDWISERVSDFSESSFEPVLLHSDFTNDHVFLTEQKGRWRISGIIDFGDAMMGHPHYDFIAPLCFFTFGDPTLSRRLVESYGLKLTPELANRLTTYCLLHRYGTVGQFLGRKPVADGEAFHAALWGTSE